MTLRQIEDVVLKLEPAERRHLAESLLASLEPCAARRLVDLEGRWAGKFPDDFDVESALLEIRSEWLKEWEGEEFKP